MAALGTATGVVVAANGDVFTSPDTPAVTFAHWIRAGNVFAGNNPVPTQPQTLGQLKVRYR